MKPNSKNEDKVCYILYTLSSVLFIFTGVSNIVIEGLNKWAGVSNIALGITFGSLALMYYKKYKSSK